jgi:hypothetical protein
VQDPEWSASSDSDSDVGAALPSAADKAVLCSQDAPCPQPGPSEDVSWLSQPRQITENTSRAREVLTAIMDMFPGAGAEESGEGGTAAVAAVSGLGNDVVALVQVTRGLHTCQCSGSGMGSDCWSCYWRCSNEHCRSSGRCMRLTC